jgi:hypothetical protein
MVELKRSFGLSKVAGSKVKPNAFAAAANNRAGTLTLAVSFPYPSLNTTDSSPGRLQRGADLRDILPTIR